jgi:methylglyoxal synthase
MKKKKRIALVAHDQRKKDLLSWVKYNADVLSKHELYATGTTGKIISEACSIDIHRLKSGPLGGDQQLGAMIANGELDMLIFLWDPMTSSTADFIISSSLSNEEYDPVIKDYSTYITRRV